jgi:hypothetical protein
MNNDNNIINYINIRNNYNINNYIQSLSQLDSHLPNSVDNRSQDTQTVNNNSELYNSLSSMRIYTTDSTDSLPPLVRNNKIKCPLCRFEQKKTIEIHFNNSECPICFEIKNDCIPCINSSSHILCCAECYKMF